MYTKARKMNMALPLPLGISQSSAKLTYLPPLSNPMPEANMAN